MSENPPYKKSFTIKDANVLDIEYIQKMKADGMTNGDVLSLLVTQHMEMSGKLQAAEEIQEIYQKNLEEYAVLVTSNKELTLHVEELTNRKPETVEKEVEKVVEKQLEGRQFICEPDEDTFNRMRVARSFIKKDQVFEFEAGMDYPNKLAQHAINYFLKEEFSHIVK